MDAAGLGTASPRHRGVFNGQVRKNPQHAHVRAPELPCIHFAPIELLSGRY